MKLTTHLTPENEASLKSFRTQLKKKEQRDRKRIAKIQKSQTHDNYGFFDIFKSGEKRYSAVCGDKPVRKPSETVEAFNQRVAEYNVCFEKEDAKFRGETSEKSARTGQDVSTVQSWLSNIMGNTRGTGSDPVIYDEDGIRVTAGAQRTDRIMGLPKPAFYVLLVLIVILIVYLAFFRKKRK